MADYSVTLTASASKELHELPDKIITRIVTHLEALAATPRPHGCQKLHGGDKEYRIRIGDYRIIYVIEDSRKIVDVTRIAHRREVYR